MTRIKNVTTQTNVDAAMDKFADGTAVLG